MQAKLEPVDDKCRLDKWLWAARFFKTRSLATTAIETGKVHVADNASQVKARVKPAKEVKLSQIIHIRNRDFEIEVMVTGLSNVRRSAQEAALLYSETPHSISKRENAKITGEINHALRERGMGRPTKRQTREIKKFTGFL